MNNINNKYILISYVKEQIKRVQAYATLQEAQAALSTLARDYTSGKIFVEHKEGE